MPDVIPKNQNIQIEEFKPKKQQGIVYISSTGSYFENPEISADMLVDFQYNIYGKGFESKLKNIIFTEKYDLIVYDEQGNLNEELQNHLEIMLDDKNVRLWPNIQRAWADVYWFGIAIFNDVWDYEGSEYRLQKLRRLPPQTFDTAPLGHESELYSDLLPGIILGSDDEPEFWQVQDTDNLYYTEPILLENIFYVKDPTSHTLAGESFVVPMVPFFEMLKFLWNAQMQQSNRIGAKVIFIKVTNPQPPSAMNGNVGDIEFAKEILENWSKSTAFPLRENMEIIDPGFKDDSNNLPVIEALVQNILDYITPVSMMTTGNDTARLGGSDLQRLNLLQKYIKGIHSWIEDQFEMLLNRYLEANHYDGYTIEIKIPEPELDTTDIDVKRAEMGIKGKALTINEIRNLLGQEELSDDDLIELDDYYKTHEPQTQTFGFMSSEANREVPRPEKQSIKQFHNMADTFSENIINALENARK